jgi:hypothetical protein
MNILPEAGSWLGSASRGHSKVNFSQWPRGRIQQWVNSSAQWHAWRPVSWSSATRLTRVVRHGVIFSSPRLSSMSDGSRGQGGGVLDVARGGLDVVPGVTDEGGRALVWRRVEQLEKKRISLFLRTNDTEAARDSLFYWAKKWWDPPSFLLFLRMGRGGLLETVVGRANQLE